MVKKMKNINVNELNIKSVIKRTTSSIIMACKYNNDEYCYKEFFGYEKSKTSINNIVKMCEIEPTEGLIFPKIIVTDNDKITGYLTTLLNDAKTLLNMKLEPFDIKYKILLKEKENIEMLHKKYGIVHADIHEQNICCSKNQGVTTIDFDESILDLEELPYDKRIRMCALEYLTYNKLGYDLDTYLFNRVTFAFLNNIDFNDIDLCIDEEYYGVFKSEESRKELKKLKLKYKQTNYLINMI